MTPEKAKRRDNHNQPPRIDLNLLDVLHVLVEERSVSRAAVRLGVTQPAVSNALARLRHQVGDPLMVKTGTGMDPTARALELVIPVREALDAMTAAVEGARRFDAATYRGDFSIAGIDYATHVFAPVFAQRLREWAPRALVRVGRASGGAREVLRAADQYHLVLSDARTAALHEAPLMRDDWRLIMRIGHPLAHAPLDLAAVTSFPFVVSRAPDDDLRAAADDSIAGAGLRRRVAVTVPSSAFVGAVVAATDHVAIICRRIAERFTREHPVVMRASPVPLPDMEVRMLWHRRHDASPLHRWLRERAREVAATL